MANFALLATGQIVGNAAAQQLPQTVPPNPQAGAPRGEGIKVNLGCLKASTTSAFYGAAGVTGSTGKEIPPGVTETITVNDTSQIYFFGAATATLTYAVYSNNG